ncbi:Putative ribonuclease H protein At1g65750 [Linum perenne]
MRVWNWKGPNKIRHFLWLVSHNKIMTNVERVKWKLTDDTSCVHCGQRGEDTKHVFRQCSFAQMVWMKFLPEVVSPTFSSMKFRDWWNGFLGNSCLNSKFGFTVWLLWRRGNHSIFEGVNWSAEEVISQVLFREQLWSSSWKTHQLGREAPRYARQTQLIGWRLGGEGWYTLNTDGSLRSSTNSATAGGIIRDDNGRFVTAFASNLGCCSVVRAEIKGIVDGMAIAWEKGIRKLRIQTDSQLAVKLLLSEENINHQHSSLVHTFQEFKARNWEITIEHVYREANNAADFLANMGHDLDLGISMFSFPCNTLMEWIRYDLVGICQPRHVNIIL